MKLFIKVFIGFLILIIAAIVSLMIFINPNDYKEQIQTQAQQKLNRTLAINGDLSWTFFPRLGFSSGEVILKNPKGFNRDNLIKIEQASVSLAISPLLKGEIQVGELTLKGLSLNLITNKDGLSNLDNLSSETASAAAPRPERTNVKSPEADNIEKSVFDIKKLELAGINIEDVQIEIQDLRTASNTKVNIDHIRLGKFVLGEEADLSIATHLMVDKINAEINLQAQLIVQKDLSAIALNNLAIKTVLTGKDIPNGELNSSIQSNVNYNLTTNKAQLSNLNLQFDQLNLEGDVSVQTASKLKVRFNLQGNDWDLTPYLNDPTEKPKGETPALSQSQAATETPPQEQEPDLSALNDVDIQGTLAIASVTTPDLKLGKISTTVDVNNGTAQIKPLTVALYEGLLTLNASVTDAKGKNNYKVDTQLKGVQIHPLLVDVAKADLLSGTTAFNFSASGSGLTLSKIKKGILGQGDFKLLDGELYGINIPHKIRTLKAKITGKNKPKNTDVKKTDFASLSGDFKIKKGIVDNTKLLMLSPVIRLDGAGLVNILNESLNYALTVTPLSKTTEETKLDDLRGLKIPLLIKGSFTDPKFSLDTEGALKSKLKDKADQVIEKNKEKLKDKLKSKLGSLFG